jgi:UDP-N-acetylglucosamine acyltransferase
VSHGDLSSFRFSNLRHTIPALSTSLIHPTALISAEARIADGVKIGPYSVIEGPVTIAENCEIAGHVLIQGKVTIARGNRIGWGSIVGADPQDLHFHPQTDSGVELGESNTLREYVTIHRGSQAGGITRIGANNFLMTGVHLAHDVQMGDHNVLANNVLLAGHIQVGNKCFLGGGSVFHQFIHIGDYAIAQGNAAISQDIPPYCMAHGNNLLAALNIIGLKRAGFTPDQRAEIKRAFRLLLEGNRQVALQQASLVTWSDAAMLLVKAVENPSRKGILTRSQTL